MQNNSLLAMATTPPTAASQPVSPHINDLSTLQLPSDDDDDDELSLFDLNNTSLFADVDENVDTNTIHISSTTQTPVKTPRSVSSIPSVPTSTSTSALATAATTTLSSPGGVLRSPRLTDLEASFNALHSSWSSQLTESRRASTPRKQLMRSVSLEQLGGDDNDGVGGGGGDGAGRDSLTDAMLQRNDDVAKSCQ
jgi:hypothetical protein